MTVLSNESRALFRSARAAMSPKETDRERVRGRLFAKIGAAAVCGAAGATVAKAAGGASAGVAGVGASGAAGIGASGAGASAGSIVAKGSTLALVAKIMAPIVVAGAAASAVPHVADLRGPDARPAPITMMSTPPSAAPASALKSAAARVAAAAPSEEALPSTGDLPDDALRAPAPVATSLSASELPNAKVEHRATITHAAGPSAPSATSEEAVLLDGIERALRAGDSASAARLANEHERRFPRGMLGEEREGAKVLARCMSGARSTAGADAFLAAHPRSPMRARILAACGSSGDEQ